VKKDTLLAHAGRDPEKCGGMVNTPVYRTSTVLFSTLDEYETRDPNDYKRVRYGRYGTPTTFALEEAVARMEGGHLAVAVPSGLAAVVAAISAFVKGGDHLLVADSVYGPTRVFCERRLRPNGVDIQYYDPLIGGDIRSLIKANTKAIYCESPGSLTFEVQDIPAISAAAREKGVPVLADNTWGTPYFFRAFERGVDVSIHSATKYIVGHSDVMMGIIVTNEKYWLPVRKAVADFGYSVSPEDCYLALRGFRTIGVRMRHQMKSALDVARWLTSRPEVQRVLYPALDSDPGYTIWHRDYEGASALFSFVLQPCDDKAVAAFIDGLDFFGIGSSWGGFESLVVLADIARYRSATRWIPGGPTIRLHIGLEDPADLIADLERGFARLKLLARS
jgi:cystathionine beta-lyase